MATRRQKHQDYIDALNLLGKDLARRAKSKCELSGVSGTLRPFDLEGPPTEPDLEHVVLVSPEVLEHLEGRGLDDRDALRYLESSVWSPEAVIRRASVHILKQIDAPWAEAAIENAESMSSYE